MDPKELMRIGAILNDFYRSGMELKSICEENYCPDCPCKCADSEDCWIEKHFNNIPADWNFDNDIDFYLD